MRLRPLMFDDGKTHPAIRGQNNAEAIIEKSGLAWARRWMTERVASTTREPLHPLYIAAFDAACNLYEARETCDICNHVAAGHTCCPPEGK